MGHNPKKTPYDHYPQKDRDRDAELRRLHLASMPKWHNLRELAALMIDRAKRGKRTILLPETAEAVARRLELAHNQPTRRDIALMICTEKQGRCQSPCHDCIRRALVVVDAYGERPED